MKKHQKCVMCIRFQTNKELFFSVVILIFMNWFRDKIANVVDKVAKRSGVKISAIRFIAIS